SQRTTCGLKFGNHTDKIRNRVTLMPWAAYVGLAAVIVSALALIIGLSRRDGRGIALALVALIGGGLIAYVPWHYDQLRQTRPQIHDMTTDPDNPPAFVAVVPLRQGEGINSVATEGLLTLMSEVKGRGSA